MTDKADEEDRLIASAQLGTARTGPLAMRTNLPLTLEEASFVAAAEARRAASVDDPVRPKHYQGDLVMRIIEHFQLGFRLGNVLKYVLRHADKAGLEDLKKAAWYLQREIEFREGKHQDGVR